MLKIVRLGIIPCSFVFAVLVAGCSLRATSVKDGRGELIVELWVSNECPSPGETVTLRATVTNKGAGPLTLELKDQPVLDIVVGNPDHSKLRWSSGKPLTLDLTRLELKPGESKTIEMQWQVDASESQVVVSAQLIDGPQSLNNPIRPLTVLLVNRCPGPFGP